MLRTNLSTRPFYNERVVYVSIGLAVALVTALTMVNANRIVTLSGRNTGLVERTSDAQRRIEQLRTAAATLRGGLGPRELDEVSTSARQANQIIDRRLFSWSELLTRFETALPEQVRIAAWQPTRDASGRVTLAVTVVGRRVEDVNRFMEALEATGVFEDVLSLEDRPTDDGALVAVIQARYGRDGVASDEAAPEGAP